MTDPAFFELKFLASHNLISRPTTLKLCWPVVMS
uniref:Uncharacterized protein n=1 Tax=Arundo donax TaxID=35708 RepID=A0A0A8YYV2_ARUDO